MSKHKFFKKASPRTSATSSLTREEVKDFALRVRNSSAKNQRRHRIRTPDPGSGPGTSAGQPAPVLQTDQQGQHQARKRQSPPAYHRRYSGRRLDGSGRLSERTGPELSTIGKLTGSKSADSSLCPIPPLRTATSTSWMRSWTCWGRPSVTPSTKPSSSELAPRCPVGVACWRNCRACVWGENEKEWTDTTPATY